MREHELTSFEVEQDGLRLKIRKEPAGAPAAAQSAAVAAPAPVPMSAGVPLAAPAASSPVPVTPPADVDIELAVVKSPIVGTFYRSSEPGTAPFVDVGSTVRKGQVLCIIEAMKLMNEIDCEYDGEIVNVYVENGQPVQYGERLFAIRTR